jgi:hypothetical protein
MCGRPSAGKMVPTSTAGGRRKRIDALDRRHDMHANGTLHLTKECSQHKGQAGAFCTVTSSNFDAIPVGSVIVYAEAFTPDGGLDTDIVINTPNGDTANGHVVLDGATQTGTVPLAGGTGQLANLKADLVVGPLDPPNYSWDGPYSY